MSIKIDQAYKEATIGTHKFNTVDELIEYYINVSKNDPEVDACKYIVYYFHTILLTTLMLKTNVPSKYDLKIIEKVKNKIESMDDRQEYLYVYNSILEYYKNRKV